jgi:hypothetical protein
MTFRNRLAAAALTLVVACLLAPAGAHAGDGWWGRLDEGDAVSLADIKATPRDFRHRMLTFFAVYGQPVDGNQLFSVRTMFNAKRHHNFRLWSDGTPVWEKRAFQADLPFVYIERANPQRDELLTLPTFTRIEVTGKVRDVLRGMPCIEVFSFRVTGHRLGRDVVRDMIAADDYARLGTREGDQLAASRYRAALRPDLPPMYDMLVRKRLAEALTRIGDHEGARRVARGEILGGSRIPGPQPVVDDPAGPGVAPSPVDTRPSHELPATDFPPVADLPPPSHGLPGLPPAAALPGAPAEPLAEPLTGAPPGTDAPLAPSPAPAGGASTPFVPGPPVLPAAGASAERPPRPAPALRGVPPKRRPRLSGVK